jgi:hypothetical protein
MYVLCFSLALPVCFLQELREEKIGQRKTKNIMEKEASELKLQRDWLQKDYNRVVQDNHRLQEAQKAVAQKAEEAQETLDEWVKEAKGRLEIRDATRGHPLGHKFVHHCQTLLVTGGSARSIREHMLLNGHLFLGETDYEYFMQQMPELQWFQFQREGMGLESMVLTFMRLAKAEHVDQWGFDKRSLDGVLTLNQWCRVDEDNEPMTLTIECAGLLLGST